MSFFSWILAVEQDLDFKEIPSDHIVKLVAMKLAKSMPLWSKNLKCSREREGRVQIHSWDKMKKMLRRKYLSDRYQQDLFLKIHNFQQNFIVNRTICG